MGTLTCDLCGSTNLIKQDGLFVCQSCGTKYSVEEAQRMMLEGTVDVTGTVKVDSSEELNNLYLIARRAKDANNSENAAKYYEQIMIKDPNSWEANFYTTYFQSLSCRIFEIRSAEINLINSYQSVLNLVKLLPKDQQTKALEEIYQRIFSIACTFFEVSKNYFFEADASIRPNLLSETGDRILHSIFLLYYLAAHIKEIFSNEYKQIYADCLQDAIYLHSEYMQIEQFMVPQKESLEIIEEKENEILEVYPDYRLPQYLIELKKNPNRQTVIPNNNDNSSQGCYVATSVYGSYNCPEVWTLRRFRDFTLDKILVGRLFIKTYYAISPTLVMLFGNTSWFKAMWKPVLDKLVSKLQRSGFDSTPYNDKY